MRCSRRERDACAGGGDAANGEEIGGRAGHGTDPARPEPKQRRADAVGLLAERALAAGFGGGEYRDAAQTQSRDQSPYRDQPQTQSREERHAQSHIGTPVSARVESGARARALPGHGPLRRRNSRGKG